MKNIDLANVDYIILHPKIDVNHFSCSSKEGSLPLQNFIRNHALDNQIKKLSTTYVAIEKDAPNIPLGFFSLANASIEVSDLPDEELHGVPKYNRFPALLIGKFAVCDEYQHQGLGTWMMDIVNALTIVLSKYSGCRYLIVESKPTSNWFYEEKCNFVKVRIQDDGNILFYRNTLTLLEKSE